MQLLFLITGLTIGAIATWLIAKNSFNRNYGVPVDQFNSLEKEKSILQDRLSTLNVSLNTQKQELENERKSVIALSSDLSQWKTSYKNMEEKLSSQKAEVEELQTKFTKEFENLANKIFDEKNRKFTEQSKTTLEDTLKPLRENISDFRKKVEDVHKDNIEKNASLKEQLISLKQLNEQMSKDAINLTKALKGESKTQGNWGEMILESILEKSGLQKNVHYQAQASMTTEDGRRLQPDFIINLPEEKHLVIDSKVSLTAYEKFWSAENETDKTLFLREHIFSIRKHIKELSEKNYQALYHIKTLDFVLMFVPVEPAFSMAIMSDQGLYADAFEKNIIIVTTPTLLATLRTIAGIWRQENQTKNSLEIARQSGELYDKFQGLISDLIDVGSRMDSAKKSYEDAMNKLHSGRGNLIGRVENLKKLGAKTSKSLPGKLLERAEDKDMAEEKKELPS